jgi:hypothetical protein
MRGDKWEGSQVKKKENEKKDGCHVERGKL